MLDVDVAIPMGNFTRKLNRRERRALGVASLQEFGGVEEFGGVAEEPKVRKRARRINRPDEELHHESLWTTVEVAQYLRVHPKTVERLRRVNGLPCLRIGGRIRYVLSDVTRWASAQEVTNAEAP